MHSPLIQLCMTTCAISTLSMIFVSLGMEVPLDSVLTVFINWAAEAGAITLIAYYLTCRFLQRRQGVIQKIQFRVHVLGVISIMLLTASTRAIVAFLYGGNSAVNPERGMETFLFVVAPLGLTFMVIKFAILRLKSDATES